MSQINFNSIYDGVSLAIRAAFPDRKVYGGNTEQGVSPGDFNVFMLSTGHIKEIGQRYRRTLSVDVIYYPKDDISECYDVAQQLTVILGSITTPEGDIIHGTGIAAQITDDVLHVLAQYDHHIYTPQEQTQMETLTIKQEE